MGQPRTPRCRDFEVGSRALASVFVCITLVFVVRGSSAEEPLSDFRTASTVVLRITPSKDVPFNLAQYLKDVEQIKIIRPITPEESDLILATSPQVVSFDGKSFDDRHLKKFSRCTSTRKLDLSSTSVTGVFLADLPQLAVRELDLSSSNVSDENLRYLKCFPELAVLKLHETSISDAAVPHLRNDR